MSRFDLRRILAFAPVYNSFSELMKGNQARRIFADSYIRAESGDRLLDIGCGPGTMRPFLPETLDYRGFDTSAAYIRNAKKSYPDGGTFVQAVLTLDVADGLEPFDIVIAVGLLHHLDDAQARILFQTAFSTLKPGGRFVTLDGAFTDDQNELARTLLKLDRGRHVRTPEAYAALARETFDTVEVTVRSDFLVLPYTHCIMDCQRYSRP